MKNRANVRSKVVAVRVTEMGYEKIKSLADRRGQSVNELGRDVFRMLVSGEILIR